MIHKTRFWITLLFSLFSISNWCAGQVVLTEVMFNPAGDEASQEWIEIRNIGDIAVSIDQWQVEIGSKVHELDLPPGTSESGNAWQIPAGSFALIVDPTYLDFQSPDDESGLPDSIPWFNIPLTLSNSTDTRIRLMNAAGNVIADYTYTTDNEEDYSDEKILPAGPDTPENWANSLTKSGTPGRRNSVTPRDHDLLLAPHPGWTPQPAVPDSTVRLIFSITNAGMQSSPETTLLLSRDQTSASSPGSESILGSVPVPPLLPSDSAQVEFPVTLPSGRHRLTATLHFAADQDTSDNSISWILPVRYPIRTVVINEIMYKPAGGDPEWIEIYYPGSDDIDLVNWSLGDPTSSASIGNIILRNDEYIVFSASKIIDAQNMENGNFHLLNGFPTLNNSGDHLFLRDATGSLIDTVAYSSAQGGGNGISLERINPMLSGTLESNWIGSVAPTGATPGIPNSVAAPERDLDLVKISAPATIKAETPLQITALVANFGLRTVTNYSIALYNDQNENGAPDPAELLHSLAGEACIPGDSARFIFPPLILSGGLHRILGVINYQDDKPSNNIAKAKISVGYPPGSVLLNEIMYHPDPGEPEWVELYIAADSVDLRGFRLHDRGHSGFFRQEKRHLYRQGQYLVVSGDSTVLQSYGATTFSMEVADGFPTLNNGTDSVRVLGADGRLIDDLRYTNSWGGGPGVSMERRNLEAPTQYAENWSSSSAPAGATPGAENSIAANDPYLLTVTRIDSVVSVRAGETFSARFAFFNQGVDTLDARACQIGFDTDGNHQLESAEIREKIQLPVLSPGDSIQVMVNLKAPMLPGKHQLVLTMDESGESFSTSSTLWVPYPRQSLLFNEVFPDPSERYPSEFVEVVNITENPLTLDGLQLQVNDRVATTDNPVVFEPGDYHILGEIDAFDAAGTVDQLPGWNNLPNTGGTLLLQDQYGNILDSLTYGDGWPLEPGRSLERVHLKPGEHSPANWRVSLDPNGATPGRPNSLYLPVDSLAAGWTVGPTPFSPDDDGSDDLLRIRYSGQDALQYVTLQIYDPAGRLIQSLAQDDGAGTTALWLWDGRDQTGDPAPIGVYVLYIEYTTIEGTSRKKLERVILAKPL